jgi:flagellar motor switch protein FliN/FliY
MAAIDERAHLQHLGDIEVQAVVELGRRRIALSEVLRLRVGDVLELEDILAGSAFPLRVNGALLAEGETVVVGERMGHRLTAMAALPFDATSARAAVTPACEREGG